MEGLPGAAAGSTWFWKCGPATSPVGPQGLTCACAAYPRLGSSPPTSRRTSVDPPRALTSTLIVAPSGASAGLYVTAVVARSGGARTPSAPVPPLPPVVGGAGEAGEAVVAAAGAAVDAAGVAWPELEPEPDPQ